MRCSVFQNDEETPGWKEGKSVAYCETCFNETMKRRESSEGQDGTVGNEDITSNNPHSSGSTETKTKRVQSADDIDEQDSGEEDDDHEDDLSRLMFSKKSKSKRKTGRRPKWNDDDVDDMVDIVVNNDYYKRKLIFRNTKNQRNGEIYERIKKELQERAAKRNSQFVLSIIQMRTKFKKCVSDCKNAAMTIKTATGIKRFQDNQGYGKWFPILFAVVKTRESCQPEQAIEPSPSPSPCSSLSQLDKASDEDLGSLGSTETEMFIPVKRARKEKKKSSIDVALVETLDLVKEVVKNDPTRDLINFMREEMDKAREHELKMFHLLQSSRPNASSAVTAYDQQQQGTRGMYQGQSGFSGSETPGNGMYQSLYNQWY